MIIVLGMLLCVFGFLLSCIAGSCFADGEPLGGISFLLFGFASLWGGFYILMS